MIYDLSNIMDEVRDEAVRAMQLHSDMNSLHEAKAVIEEKLDEFWELVKVNPKKLSGAEQTKRLADLHSELIQTAAMCVRSIVDLELY